MTKTAYVFPGQGSQFCGMARDLYDSSQTARKMLENANDILGFRITDIMFDGTADDLKVTRVTQPAVFLHSVVLAACLEQFHPDMAAGHSLGEFSALAACGAISFEDALKLVSVRAEAMQKACEETPSAMAAIIGLEDGIIEQICESISDQKSPVHSSTANPEREIVVPANYNCPGQVVISGTVEAIQEACRRMKEAGARRALPLAVSGAFHSPLMASAREQLATGIRQTRFSEPVCPIYQNFSAKASTDPETIKQNLLEQLTSPVKWTQSVRSMIEDGATTFIELGPGKVLQGLVNRIAGTDSGICAGSFSSISPKQD